MELLLDGRSIRSEALFHDVIDRAALSAGFDGYGRNLDALWDVLTAILPIPVEVRWTDSDASRQAIGPRFDMLVQVMRDAEKELGPADFRLRVES
ncbi:MAG TPA: barstar family protein [Allosphingosinicella sp.]|nr:barstar family protein [Allosphingosinicella sp.]